MSHQTKTFSASVTDSQPTSDTASDEVLIDLAPPLPAPTRLRHASYPDMLISSWNDVRTVGRVNFTNAPGYPDCNETYAVRYRSAGSSESTHVMAERQINGGVWEMSARGVHVMSVAARRDPIQLLTPAALQWSDSHSYATVQRP